MSKMTNKEIASILGDHAKSFSDKGITFFRLRSNGAQGDVAQKMMSAISKNTLKIPAALNEEAAKTFGYAKLTPPMLAIIMLGRPPVLARTGGIQESGKILDADQKKVAAKIAEAIKTELYKNHVRKPAVETPAVETPKAVAKPKAAPKVQKQVPAKTGTK